MAHKWKGYSVKIARTKNLRLQRRFARLERLANAFTARQAVWYGERQRAGALIMRPHDQGSRSLTLPVPYRRSRHFPVHAIALERVREITVLLSGLAGDHRTNVFLTVLRPPRVAAADSASSAPPSCDAASSFACFTLSIFAVIRRSRSTICSDDSR